MAGPDQEVPPISAAADNAAGTSGEIAEENLHCWTKEVEEECERASRGSLWLSNTPPDDERVPKIRKPTSSDREQLCQPRAVTIGPFHRDEMSTHITDNEKYLIVDLMNRLYDLNLKGCLRTMKTQVAEARKCYSDSDMPESFGSANDRGFAEMLLLDSYFILFMLTFTAEIRSEATCEGLNLYRPCSSKSLKIMPGKLSKKQKNVTVALHIVPRFADILRNKDSIAVDLLILQNQIPFFVIEKLFEELKLKKPLYKYALRFFETIHPRSARRSIDEKRRPEFSHLLHLFHWSRVAPKNKCNTLRSWRPQLDDFYCNCYTPTATKLRKSATTGFKRKTSGSSLDITFRRDRLIPVVRVLSIPRIHIHEYSSCIFHNLIAFEMQCPSSDRRTVTFSVIMQNLLQSEEDVELLRRRGILAANAWMTDYKIINFFKSLRRTAERDAATPIDVYVLCRQVLSYCERRRTSRFWANAILKYFPNW